MIRTAAVLAVADASTTHVGLERGAVEANPMAGAVAQFAGPLAMLAVGITATLALAWWATRTRRTWLVVVVCLALGLKAAVVVSNLVTLGAL